MSLYSVDQCNFFHPMPSSSSTACKGTVDFSSVLPVNKKQKTSSAGIESANKKKKISVPSTPVVKAVKTVDPAIIEQRRDAVQSRVLKLESKLAKDRALLAKYSMPVNPAVGEEPEKDSGEEEEQGAEPNGVGDE
jgi:hypothetical protein